MRHNTLGLISLQTRPKYLSFITYYEYLRFAFLCYLGDKIYFGAAVPRRFLGSVLQSTINIAGTEQGENYHRCENPSVVYWEKGDVNCYLDVKESAKRAATHDCYPMMSRVRLQRQGLTSVYGRGGSATRP